MLIKGASGLHTREVIQFFNRHLIQGNDGVSNSEFFCPLGLNAAIRNGQVLIALNDNHIVGALRYYKRKTKNSISLYQFAIDPLYRGKGLLKEMLLSLGAVPIEYQCPLASDFNNYFVKSGWSVLESNNKYNLWMFNSK